MTTLRSKGTLYPVDSNYLNIVVRKSFLFILYVEHVWETIVSGCTRVLRGYYISCSLPWEIGTKQGPKNL